MELNSPSKISKTANCRSKPNDLTDSDSSNSTASSIEIKVHHKHSKVNRMKHVNPSNISFKSSIQSILVLLHNASIIMFCAMFFLAWCIPYLWPFMIYYTLFKYLFDRTPVNGQSWKRRSEWFRNLPFWKLLIDYYPISLHKLQDLTPTFEQIEDQVLKDSKLTRTGPKYIFGYHPHGIIATGVSTGFTNNAAGWTSLFPGILCYVTTLVNQFQVPFYRDYLMALGVTTVVKRNLKLLLDRGASIVIVVGGARESLMAKPGTNSIVLFRRKGFIRLALESIDEKGVCVVPVYGFGENDIFNVFSTDEFIKSEKKNKDEGEFESQNSSHHSNIVLKNLLVKIKKLIYNFQMFLKNRYGWTLPIVISRGVFNHDFGILPYRKPIRVVFGKPIKITRLHGRKIDDEITDDEVDYWHQKYIEGLYEVWEYGKNKFDLHDQQELEIIQ